MKKNYLDFLRWKTYLLVIGLVLITLSGCKKEIDLDASTATIGKKRMDPPPVGPVNPALPLQVQQLEAFAGYNFTSTPIALTEYQAQQLAAPLLANSITYFHTLGLSDYDLIGEFGSLSDANIANVAFIMKAIDVEIQSSGIPGCDSDNLVVKCLVRALIPCSIMDAFSGELRDQILERGFSQAFSSLSYSAKKTIINTIGKAAAKYIGKRFLGAVTFAWDFGSCLYSGGSEVYYPVEGYADLTDSTVNVPTPSQPEFPNVMMINVRFTKYLDNIGSNWAPPFYTTNIYKHGDLYYFDRTLTHILPDGYYLLDGDLPNKYYKVLNGVVVQIAVANNDPNAPISTDVNPSNPFYIPLPPPLMEP